MSTSSTPSSPPTAKRLEGDWRHIHGFLGDPSWPHPLLAAESSAISRPGYDNKTRSHEYVDDPSTLREKVKVLASLIRRAHNFVLYSGAGISTASGIDDYATKAKESLIHQNVRTSPQHPIDAAPTLSHRVLTRLCVSGHCKRWVQQNHDGLPQKAGLPQSMINEIHGAWYDVSNPVVMMSGALRTDLFNDLLQWESKADFVLAVGTSLSGMNADRIVSTCAQRAVKKGDNTTIGSAIISLQCTQYDKLSCLRIFERIDRVMEMLGEEMDDVVDIQKVREDVEKGRVYQCDVPAEYRVGADGHGEEKDADHIYSIPYGENGLPLSGSSPRQTLDLREGSKVKITMGEFAGDEGEVVGTNREGHFKICFKHDISKGSKGKEGEGKKKPFMAPMVRILGLWWIEGGVKGTVPYFPVTNVAS